MAKEATRAMVKPTGNRMTTMQGEKTIIYLILKRVRLENSFSFEV